MNKQVPEQIIDLIQIYTPVHALRSEETEDQGDRVFFVVTPRLRNALPLQDRTALTVESFKSHAKGDTSCTINFAELSVML